MRLIALSFSLAAAVLGAGAATAQTVADRADARCILVLQVAARDPRNQEAAVRGTFYFVGRLSQHGLQGASLEPVLLNEAKQLNGTSAQGEMTRCGAELSARSAELQTTFSNLQKFTGAASAVPAPAPAAPPKK